MSQKFRKICPEEEKMSKIVSEAIEIFNDLKDVVIIGAVAVMLHTKKSRTSFDVDVAVAGEISREDLLDKGYIPISGKRDSWNTPRGGKVDLFRDDVSGIPIETIIKTAVDLTSNSKNTVKVAALEALIVAKYRSFNSTYRPNDKNDLQIIARRKFNEINWNLLRKLTLEQFEYEEIKKAMTAFQNY